MDYIIIVPEGDAQEKDGEEAKGKEAKEKARVVTRPMVSPSLEWGQHPKHAPSE